MVTGACHPSYIGSLSRNSMDSVSTGINARPYLKNNEREKNLGCGSSGRAPTWQLQDPESKSLNC
jgi:hypothetical protein